MATTRQSPTVRRRRLAAELRALRHASAKSAAEVARELGPGWSEGKVLYIESGKGVKPNPRDIEDLCDRVYEVAPATRDHLVQLARDGRMKGWWDPYRKMLSPVYSTYIGLEAEASAISSFESLMVPGLLQTEDYARALILDGPNKLSGEAVERRVEVRAERQKLFNGPDPIRLWAVLDEAALRRVVGGPAVMRAQLHRLIEMSELPHVTLQVLPFSKGAHPGIGGPFSILSFPHSVDDDAVYVEAIAGELFIEDDDEVGMFKEAFLRLTAAALPLADTIAEIAAAADDLK